MASLLEYPSVPDPSFDDRMVRGADGLLRYPGLTPCLTELLDVAVHRHAGREAVVEAGGGPRLTYGQLWTSASRVAGGLLEQGVGIGDRVAIRLENGVRWVQAFLGVLLAGGVPVPVHPGHAGAGLRHILADSGSLLVLDGDLPGGTPFIDDGAAPDDAALMFYTGGTTGTPKGVELSHENVLSAVEAVARSWGDVRDGTRHAIALPLSSAAGCVAQLLPTLVSGGTVVLAPARDADALLRAVDIEGVERLCAPARILRRVADASQTEYRTLRALAYDDELLSATTSSGLGERFPAAERISCWGMTETGGAGLILRATPAGDRPELPHGGMEFAVAASTGDGGAREMWCRGPSVMRGYWRDPAATARTIADGWLRTGDVVRIGQAGDVRFVGRAADAVEIPRGVVYSREIEGELLAFPGVEEAAVVGVMTARGPDLGVAVVPAPRGALDLDAVREYLDGPLGHRLPPRLCVSMQCLPRGSTGRVDRRSVRSRLEGSCSVTKGNNDVG